jgi:hypothetical protein
MSLPRDKFENGCLGPYSVGAVDDYVRGRVVAQQQKPVILQDGERYAVLAPPTKDLRIVCAGCFVPGMTLLDDSKCKKVSSFSQHLDLNKGQRKVECKASGENSLDACLQRIEGVGCLSYQAVVDPSALTTDQLIHELVSRNELDTVVTQVETDDLVDTLKDRGVKMLVGARFEDLEAELRRVVDGYRPSVQSFYYCGKIDGVGHVSDTPLIEREEHGFLAMRGAIKNKRERESFHHVLHPARPDKKRYKTRSK